MKYKRLLSAITFMMALSAPLSSAEYVTIGTGTSISTYFPYGTDNRYSTTQSIYTAAEMGGAKTIVTIAYQVALAGALSTDKVEIYMGHTTKSYFRSEYDYEDVSGMTLVYSGSPTLAASTGWEEFTLTTPFAYNGTSNLVVVVAKQASSYNYYSGYYCSFTSNAQCLYIADNYSSSYGDATTYSNFYTSTGRAYVRFGYELDLRQDGISYIFTSDTEASVVRCTATTGAVTIPATVTKDGKTYSVTSIGNYAFYGCSGLTSISIPSSVTSIGSYAFNGCSRLTSLTIPSSVTNIGYDAFTGCTSIKEVKIEDGTTTLKLGYKSNSSNSSYYYGLFKDCPIEKLYLGRNLSYSTRSYNSYNSSYPGYGAPFEYQSKLKSVEIGKNVTSIGNDAFTGCTGIKEVKIEDGTTTLKLGYKSNSSKSSYYYGLFKDCPIEKLYLGRNLSYSTHSYESSYPGNGAPFEYQSKLKSVEIGKGVTSIGDDAFYGCSGLTSLTISSSVTSIGSYAFYGCSGLTSLTIPSSVTSIGYSAIEGCSGLTSLTIPSSVTSIGSYAFNGCSGLTSLTIPSSVISIGSYAFNGCTGKLTVNCNIGSASSYSEGWFYGSKFSSVEISKDVTSIGNYAFYGNSNIKSLTIGSGVTSIGSNAFNYRPTKTIWLTNTPPSGYSVAEGKVNYVSNNNFTSLSNTKVYAYLSSMFEANGIKYVPVNPSERTCDAIDYTYLPQDSIVTIGKTVSYRNISMTVKHINDYVAYRNSNVKELTIEADGNTNQYAFYGNSKLQKVNLNNTGNIGSYAFYGCTVLQSAEISNGGNVGEQAFAECTALQTAEISNTGNIGSSAFYGCTALQTAQISNTGNIESQAFYGCKALQSAQISNTGNIGSSAFYGCTALQTAQISNTGNIESQAFYNCSQLSTCTVGDAVTAVGDKAFYSCSSLPAIQLGKNIKTIGSYAFYGCSNLEEIAIPDATTSLGANCFQDCKSLKKADTGDGITAIPSYAFSGCSALETITIGEGVKTIDTYAFQNCKKLADIAIPSNVSKIDNYVFAGCSKLADVVIADRKLELSLGYNGSSKPLFSDCPLDSIYIGGKITYSTSSSYGYSPFYRNTSLRTIVITDEETEIYDNEFYGCTGLKNVKIGDGVKKIGDYAFSGCSSLESFGFGEGMKSIGKEAFSDCISLTRILSEAAVPPTCGSQALEDINKWECTLYVPKANIAAYQAADQWKDFFFVEENVEFTNGIESVIEDTDAKVSPALNLQGQRIAAPAKGEIYILQGKKMLMK